MQVTNAVLMVRPAAFGYNEQTAKSNAFQQELNIDINTVAEKAVYEFDQAVGMLVDAGIDVLVIDDIAIPPKPDAVFPNNWASFHKDGTVVLYPMCTLNRRLENRPDVLDTVSKKYAIEKIIDFTPFANEEKFLEGTGSIVFDHHSKIAYACRSVRTNEYLLNALCEKIGYRPISFSAIDEKAQEIYHTNVMMCIGEKFAIVCAASILHENEKQMVIDSITKSGHEIIDINHAQMLQFAGNMLELCTRDGKSITALSQAAFNSLNSNQKSSIEKYSRLLPLPIPTIETVGGGSVRCMIAEIFLPKK